MKVGKTYLEICVAALFGQSHGFAARALQGTARKESKIAVIDGRGGRNKKDRRELRNGKKI